MKFADMKYKRPNMEELKNTFNKLLLSFEEAHDFETENKLLLEINNLRVEFESMEQIVYIRHTINTKEEFYEKEQEFFDENKPEYDDLVSKFYKTLMKSNNIEELKDKWGEQLFTIASLTIDTFSEDIIDDLKEENKLMSEYTKVLAAASINFNGEVCNLSQMRPYQMNEDRNTRKEANEAKYEFFEENEEKLDTIYDNLVRVRTNIAKKLGYENFTHLGYKRMLRSDYTPEMVATFREEVLKYIVPFCTELREMQRKELGVNKLKYYDELITFKDGNANLAGDPEYILKMGERMYNELSPETKIFFKDMVEKNCMDLLSKKGKSPGGYCTYIGSFNMPYIFSNFNGTIDDVDVLTHEAGHAFQVYESREYDLVEYKFPTLDACEIHSMSMEFLTWPWMNLFFGEEADKYRYGHLINSILFIPYGVLVDEFQHIIYNNPQMNPVERKRAWRELEKKYLPHRDYENNQFLERGSYWYQQGHIFKNPFYYIDYTLAQICAFQFWSKANKNRQEAWQDYINLCKRGGSLSFLKLVKSATLKSPFERGVIEPIVQEIKNWIDKK
ncbi:M3 family oligoendopeptidase [Anaeromicrobium sediminis]|uniref:Oligoendopeptidase F n=1 Tax=Anaeromicrobium sediminis TaxID=1478221 RepID=A0A267MAW2_9FIRM|nr:M3 family oligoendopeptidase [Anaeromicrobium sediminis]PAB56721.1 oligoendopeptidase F [Anaeromicrobium sediminis]